MLLTHNLVKKMALPSLALVLLLIVVAYLAGVFNDVEPEGVKSQPVEYQGELYRVGEKQVSHHEIVNANVIAKENTLVSSRLLAQLKTLQVRAGQSVKAGQLLATIDDADLQARVSQAKAQQDAIAVQLQQAKKQLARNESLQAQGLVAVNMVDEWRTKVDELVAQELALSEQLEGAKVALSDSKILSPINGTVVQRLQEPGAMLTPGTAIVSLYNPAQLQVSAPVREQQASQLMLEDDLKIHIPASGVTQYAKVSEIVPVVDSNARRFMVKLDIELAQNVKPGMYAQLYLPPIEHKLVVIPNQYVKRYGQLTMVEVVENGHVQRRFVRLGALLDNALEGEVVVLSGLSAGEMLAVH
ncbi:resistance-nodulation-cell division (RND) efflux membrane fusion protein [Pseudoalteromonas sp. A25]|uniref:efflux RND transporter periplasmic adaptor subunit n=1 Tax=Pseudoalteromonas sp. A25 TaxID=116092 RepID=UPI00126068F8|nr:efflux RND transporter periplasmic adaptor subunit [Pseudoalteromonas sp. A25]BBN80169.1 resistance-nodulation-cell division (RND) efflux membrane fusion protein [Pseudoalteromonas sp. A25]